MSLNAFSTKGYFPIISVQIERNADCIQGPQMVEIEFGRQSHSHTECSASCGLDITSARVAVSNVIRIRIIIKRQRLSVRENLYHDALEWIHISVVRKSSVGVESESRETAKVIRVLEGPNP